MASAMLKHVAVDRSQSDSETISLPVQISLANMTNDNVFDRIRKATITSNVSSANKRNPGPEPSCSTSGGSPNRRHGSDASCRDSGQSFDKFAKCFEVLTSTTTAGFSSLRSDIAELATGNGQSDADDSESYESSDMSDNDYETHKQGDSNDRSTPKLSVNDLIEKSKMSGSVAEKSQSTKNESASNLLKVLTEQVTAQDLTTDPINKDLAKLVNELMFKEKTDKKLSEQVKTSAEKIKRPENCDGLVCTKVDELIWNRLQSTTKSMDSRFQHGQLFLVKSVTLIVNVLDKLVSDKEVGKEDLVRELMKAVEMLSFSNYEINMRRRECLKSDIDSVNYLSLFSSAVPINQYLFGGDLGKKLDEIEKTNKAVNKVMSQSGKTGKTKSQKFRRYNPYKQGPRRNNPFLGQGPRKGAYSYTRKGPKGKKKQD
ncbi:hypothetical protein FSP39_024536 [Pinctada imbricata]|uniref:Uncharacterized protein n=1 Tax=Pinctada imbricata TaxID=66713 RepID=A0AA89BSP1_PINIB|nr:hypothetical protein FSP39_024536 [Pinctada imbricata]